MWTGEDYRTLGPLGSLNLKMTTGGGNMTSSNELGELAKALAKAQSEMTAAKKTEENPYFHSKYADLANVWANDRKALTSNGFSVIQGATLMRDEGGLTVGVVTRLLHVSGQWIESVLGCVPKDCLPQTVGGAVTYLRRYGYQALVGSTAEGEDDDGEGAEGRGKSTKLTLVKETGSLPNKKNAENPIDEKLEGFRKRFSDLKQSGYFTQAEMKNMNTEIEKIKNEVPSLGFLLGKWELDLADRKSHEKNKLDEAFIAGEQPVVLPKEDIF
jgi:hypothetical protein